MALHDREAIVATVEETYALMGRAVGAEIAPVVVERSVRPEIMQQIRLARVDPYVTDEEMLGLLREAYLGLVENVLRIHDELLNAQGERYDPYLENAGLTGNGRAVKVRGFRRAIEWLRDAPGVRWVRKAFEWGNIILGSLGGVPVVGVVSDPVRELKEAIEAQGEDRPDCVTARTPSPSLQSTWHVVQPVKGDTLSRARTSPPRFATISRTCSLLTGIDSA